MSVINIKNIAVCMYGQYRTGDACLEYIKEFYNIEDINVDFFCSLKNYETSQSRLQYNKDTSDNIQGDTVITSEDELWRQIDNIQKHLSPITLTVCTTEDDNQFVDTPFSTTSNASLPAWTNIIMQKQAHECKTDITYDLVVMQRYDVIIAPRNSFKKIVSDLQGLDTAERHTYSIADKNLLFIDPVDVVRKNHRGIMYPNAQDLWAIGLGTALDVIAYDALEYIPSGHNSITRNRKFHNGYAMDIHEILGIIPAKMNIPKFTFPMFREDGKTKYPYITITRSTYWEDGDMPNFAKLSDDEIWAMRPDLLKKWSLGL
jgi:hypothetical protein